MKIYKTSNWRDIVELEAIRTDENSVTLPPINPESKLSYERREIKRERKNSLVQFWDTEEEASQYLIEKLNTVIAKYEKQIFKAKSKIESLSLAYKGLRPSEVVDNSGSLRLVSSICVNSPWTASWLQKKGLDHCQCGFECKVRVQVERNGHAPQTYIVTKKEYNKLRKELFFFNDH